MSGSLSPSPNSGGGSGGGGGSSVNVGSHNGLGRFGAGNANVLPPPDSPYQLCSPPLSVGGVAGNCTQAQAAAVITAMQQQSVASAMASAFPQLLQQALAGSSGGNGRLSVGPNGIGGGAVARIQGSTTPATTPATMLVNSIPAGVAASSSHQHQQLISAAAAALASGNPSSFGSISVGSPGLATSNAIIVSSANTAASAAAVFNAVSALNATGATATNVVDLLSAFECPVCMEYMLPPYLQCPAGHLVCGTCRPKLNHCPTCRGPVPSIRNLAMEKIAHSVMFPCKFSQSGCVAIFPHMDKTDHEEICEYRPYNCPCPGASCKWQGRLDQVMLHLMKMHKSITTLQGEDIVFLATDINLPGAVDWVMLQSCFNAYFMLVLEKQDKHDQQSGQTYQMFYAIVQLIGTKKDAENFVYRLELSSNRRRLCWEATPRSITENVATAIAQSDCLAFDTNHAQLFAENGNLGINVTISNLLANNNSGNTVSIVQQ